MSFLTSHLIGPGLASVLAPVLTNVPRVVHGFGTKAEPVPGPVVDQWEARAFKKQVHGVAIAEATALRQDCGEVDAITTRVPGIAISAMTADCVPILLARRDGARVAAVHAGWRGTRGRILRVLWSKLAAEGERPADWVAAIGPAIGPCCYQVADELAEGFAREFAALLPREQILPAPRMLDLPALNEAELREIGLGGVDLVRACTRCALSAEGQPRFNSYRRDGDGQRQWAAIMIAPG